MSEPISREEETEDLQRFRNSFRRLLINHRANRLELFFLLQFPKVQRKNDWSPCDLNPVDELKALTPESIKDHQLYHSVCKRFILMEQVAGRLLEQANTEAIQPKDFRKLASAIRRLDSAIDRFEAATTASMTDIDELTGLLNRAAMERDLEKELATATREHSSLCIAMVDADHFKKVNDDLGHGFGDRVLEELADRFEASVRCQDRVYRFGGEEFLVILPSTTLEEAELVLDRLREEACASEIADDESKVTQTVSAGVALANEQDTSDELIERADQALYQAKSSGRNCVVASKP